MYYHIKPFKILLVKYDSISPYPSLGLPLPPSHYTICLSLSLCAHMYDHSCLSEKPIRAESQSSRGAQQKNANVCMGCLPALSLHICIIKLGSYVPYQRGLCKHSNTDTSATDTWLTEHNSSCQVQWVQWPRLNQRVLLQEEQVMFLVSILGPIYYNSLGKTTNALWKAV